MTTKKLLERPENPLEVMPGRSYGLWDYGVLTYEKAEALFERRGWQSKGKRMDKKKMADGTYLCCNQEIGKKEFVVKYYGTPLVTIRPHHRWIIHPCGKWGTTIGSRTRINTLAPVNYYTHNYNSYLGCRSQPHYVDTEIDYTWHYKYGQTWHGGSVRNSSFSHEEYLLVFRRAVTFYLHNYFCTWASTPWSDFHTKASLRSSHIGKTSDRLPYRGGEFNPGHWWETHGLPTFDGFEDKVALSSRDNWITTVAKNKDFIHGSVLQALAYLTEVPFTVHTYDYANPYPEWLSAFASHQDCAYQGRYHWRRRNDTDPVTVLIQIRNECLSDLIRLMWVGCSQKARQDAEQEPEQPEQGRRRPDSLYTRVAPYVDISDLRNYSDKAEQTNEWGRHTYLETNKFQSYYPRVLLLTILDYYVRKGTLTADYVENLCLSSFDGEANFWQQRSPDIGHESDAEDVKDAMYDSKFGTLFGLLYSFFLEKGLHTFPGHQTSGVTAHLPRGVTDGVRHFLDDRERHW